MNPVSKLLVGLGVLFILAGLFWQFGNKIFPLGRLPGDIIIEKENLRVFFPLTTSLVISAVVSLILFLIRSLGK